MTKYETLEAGCRGMASVLFAMTTPGEFIWGWREDLNKKRAADANLTVLAEWPTGALIRQSPLSSNAESSPRGIPLQQVFLFGHKPVDGKTQFQLIDDLQGYAQFYLSGLNELNAFVVKQLNRGVPIEVAPKGFTTDNSVWILCTVDYDFFDCTLPPFPSGEGEGGGE